MAYHYVTDHKFILKGGRLYDRFGFRRDFFQDYEATFGRIHLVARTEREQDCPTRAMEVGIPLRRFVNLGTVSGPRWLVMGGALTRRALSSGVDASLSKGLWLRAPSQSADAGARWASRNGIRYGVEVVGDPYENVRATIAGSAKAEVIGRLLRRRLRRTVRNASVVTYVDRHLYKEYPPARGVTWETVSSLRMPRSWIAAEARPHHWFELRRSEGWVVVTIGSLLPVKNVDLIIRAVSQAASDVARLDIVGDGPARPMLERLVAELGLEKVVTFHGHIASRERIKSILDSADLFCLASRTEGLPRAAVEAMARALPVLATDIPGARSLIGPAMLFSPDHPDALARLFQGLTADRAAAESSRGLLKAREYEESVLSSRRRAALQHLTGMEPL